MRRDIVIRSLKVAAVVGTVLVGINHGDAIWMRDIDAVRVAKMLLIYVVPYAVSTYAAVSALQLHTDESAN